MADKESFIRFKNRLLGQTFLNDGTHFAVVLGKYDFQFWSYIEEKAPYLPLSIPLKDVTRGQIILERIELEPSPKRLADLLQAVYETFAFYSITPKGEYDDHWLQFARWLQNHIESSGFSGMRTRWLKEPEVCYTPEPIVERYYLPGEFEIKYVGQDWAEIESKKVLENGFSSRILKEERGSQKLNSKHTTQNSKKRWWDKTWVQVVGLIAAVITIITFFRH